MIVAADCVTVQMIFFGHFTGTFAHAQGKASALAYHDNWHIGRQTNVTIVSTNQVEDCADNVVGCADNASAFTVALGHPNAVNIRLRVLEARL